MPDTSELDALIIRNLTEIEQGHDRIIGDIEHRLDKEAGELFEAAAAKAGWRSGATRLDDDFWLVNPLWQVEEGTAEVTDCYVTINLDWNSKGPDVSWAQTFVGGQGSSLLLNVTSDAFTSNKWLKFLKEKQPSKLVERLTKNSRFRFEPDNKTEPLALPVRIDQEELALAFLGDLSFEEALAPLAAALEEILTHENCLDDLAKLARKADA